MKKPVVFNPAGSKEFFEDPQKQLETLIKNNIVDLTGTNGIITNFENNLPIGHFKEGYILPAQMLLDLVKEVDEKKIKGIAIKFGVTAAAQRLHLVFVPIVSEEDGTYNADYTMARSTFDPNPPNPDPILDIPPHGA